MGFARIRRAYQRKLPRSFTIHNERLTAAALLGLLSSAGQTTSLRPDEEFNGPVLNDAATPPPDIWNSQGPSLNGYTGHQGPSLNGGALALDENARGFTILSLELPDGSSLSR